MQKSILFKTESEKPIERFIEDLKQNAPEFNFTVRHVLDMAEEYRRHGVEVEDGFQLYQVIICNFKRSYQTIQKDSERAAVLLPPKQMSVYRQNGKTVINYLPFTEEIIAMALPGQEEFQKRLAKTCRNIIELIKKSC